MEIPTCDYFINLIKDSGNCSLELKEYNDNPLY